jgi:hypothetical protein
MKPNHQERWQEWVTLLIIVVILGLQIAGLSTLREREPRFEHIETMLERIEAGQNNER